MVSILMSTYNETIEEVTASVESMLNQTYQDMELIIVLDNPLNEHVNQWVKDMAVKTNGKVRVVEHQENKGLVQSLNDAFAVSQGELLARMDADDISVATRLEKQVQYMEMHPECAVLGCNRIDIDEESNVIHHERRVIEKDKQIKKILRYGVPFTHPSIMMRREALEKVGGYRDIVAAEDYDLYLRFLKNGEGFANLSDRLIKYRVRKTGISISRSYEMLLGKKYAYDLYRYGESAKRKECLSESKIENYKEYVQAIKNRKIGKVVRTVWNDKLLLGELYRNSMFKLLYQFGGSNVN